MVHRVNVIGIHILAFFVARCQMLGMYPFVVPFFMAAYIEKQSSISLYLVMLLGIFGDGSLEAGFKYTLVLGALFLLLQNTNRKKVFSTNGQIALACGVILASVGLPYEYMIHREDVWLYYSILEGIIASCGVFVFEQGIVALRVGTGRRFATNERFIGVFSLMAVFLFGCPGIMVPFHLLFFVSGYLLLYYAYRFDSGIGMTTGCLTGICMAVRMNDIAWLAAMILLAGLIVLLRELGKVGVILGFFAGYLLLGFLYRPDFLNLPVLIGAIGSVFLFAITPSVYLRKIMHGKDGGTIYSQNLLVQEITKNRILEFGNAFCEMEKLLLLHEKEHPVQIPCGLSNVYLSGDGIPLLNAMEMQSNRFMDMRRNFVRQLGQIGETIIKFSGQLSDTSVRSEMFESRITERLSQYGIMVTKGILVQNVNGQTEAYISCVLEKGEAITGNAMADMVGQILNKEMVCVKKGDDNPSKKESTFMFAEKWNYMLSTGIVKENRQGESRCGDNFSMTKTDSGKALLMLSDGMGSGITANTKSEQVVNLAEQLLSSGFQKELAIWLINSFISFLSDGNDSSTLDMAFIDLYDGSVNFIKLGASTTFIKRKDSVECIHSTSLPIGMLEQVEFDTCDRKLYHGDIIVMISDGIMDGVLCENKESYLADLIAGMDVNNAQVIAQKILEDVRIMNGNCLRDDSTVLVAALWDRV